MKASRQAKLALVAAAVLTLAGCAAPNLDAALKDANELASPIAVGATASLALDDAQRQHSARFATDLLSMPLAMEGAAQLAVANSPSFQAALAQSWGELAAARQAGLPGGVAFSFERLREGGDLEIGRLLSFGLFELIALPRRMEVSRLDQEAARVRMAGAVVDQVARARQAWVRAVAAREALGYAEMVKEAAEASAELARRMQAAGNFSKLQAARQHLFYADATSRLAAARQLSVATREALVRELGLSDDQAQALKLPERLPDLPKSPRASQEISKALASQRLDTRLARLELEAAGRSRGVDLARSLVDVELGARHDTKTDAAGGRSNVNGWELDIRLPLFDWGATRRAALDANALAAVNRYEAVARVAGSQARESYGAYRTAFDQARHQREELVPLRKLISEENVLRYNGMLIGVFELLADARDQVAAVVAAIEAQRDFWLADVALSTTLIGRPIVPAAWQGLGASTAAPGSQAAH